MHSTANRIIVLGGHMSINDANLTLDASLARRQNIIATSVSAMDYGTGQTADFPVSPGNASYNPLNSFGATCGYDASTKYIQCFGGQLTGEKRLYNILSTFDTTTMKWIRSTQFTEISGYVGAAGAILGSSFYLYGGHDGDIRSENLFRIDLTTYTLTRINASGTSPGGRKDHCIAALSDTKFIMHGGLHANDSMGYVNNVHIYDTQSNTWTDVTPDNSTSSAPSARFGTGCTVLNGSFYTFGGSDGTRRNDLWVLEPPNWTWRRLSADGAVLANVPDPRYYTRLVTLGKYLITYGGANAVIATTITRAAYDTLLYFYNTQTGAW
ncbi:hypothetical protein HK104_002857, partial [Borealophlyctis nickersoniae]